MRIVITDSYEQMGLEAANIVAGQIYLKPDSVLGLATGSTPVSMYERLVAVHPYRLHLIFCDMRIIIYDRSLLLSGLFPELQKLRKQLSARFGEPDDAVFTDAYHFIIEHLVVGIDICKVSDDVLVHCKYLSELGRSTRLFKSRQKIADDYLCPCNVELSINLW